MSVIVSLHRRSADNLSILGAVHIGVCYLQLRIVCQEFYCL
jgi:hypothetical protein